MGCFAIGLPPTIAIILDQTNFLGGMHPLWWISYVCATAGCFLLLPWSLRGFPKLLLTGGVFGVVNAVLFLSTPSPHKSIYWECAHMVSGLFVSSVETAPMLPIPPAPIGSPTTGQ